MTVFLYCIYDLADYEELDYSDMPEEAWEYMKRFDLDKVTDFNDFCAQLDSHYMKNDITDLCYGLIRDNYYYDYVNGFKYVLELN